MLSRSVRTAHILLAAMWFAAGAKAGVEVGRFAPGSLADWEQHRFKGETDYRLIDDDHGDGRQRVLRAHCDGTASAIGWRHEVDLTQTPVLHWQWRVDAVHAGLDGHTKAGDDYPARVYIVHDGGLLPWRTRAINYVWANTAAPGSHWPNAFTDKAMMVALASGAPKASGRWIAESRNVRRDFKRFYDLDLDTVDGIAIMTDCDNAGGSATADYRHIRFDSE